MQDDAANMFFAMSVVGLLLAVIGIIGMNYIQEKFIGGGMYNYGPFFLRA